MCGRFVAASSPNLLAERFHVDIQRGTDGDPDYNVAPRENILVVRDRPDDDAATRVLSRLRWGLVPSWAKDPAIGDRIINARPEPVAPTPPSPPPLPHPRPLTPPHRPPPYPP